MSHAFLLEKQQRQHKRGCTYCRKARFLHRGRRYNLCTDHLEAARQEWMRHVNRRVAKGQCVNCPAPHLRGEQRCASCKEVNRQRCQAWSRDNYPQQYRLWVQRKHAFYRLGLCPQCPEHRRLAPGFRRCSKCRVVNNEYRA